MEQFLSWRTLVFPLCKAYWFKSSTVWQNSHGTLVLWARREHIFGSHKMPVNWNVCHKSELFATVLEPDFCGCLEGFEMPMEEIRLGAKGCWSSCRWESVLPLRALLELWWICESQHRYHVFICSLTQQVLKSTGMLRHTHPDLIMQIQTICWELRSGFECSAAQVWKQTWLWGAGTLLAQNLAEISTEPPVLCSEQDWPLTEVWTY